MKKFQEYLNEATKISKDEAKAIGNEIGIDWKNVDLDEFTKGINVEFEHGKHDPETNVTGDNKKMTAKIAWAHLKERKDYYTMLKKVEND